MIDSPLTEKQAEAPTLSPFVLIDINALKKPLPPTFYSITPKLDLTIRSNTHTLNSPIFKFIIEHPDAVCIPSALLSTYEGSFNISNQTPLMLAAAISNKIFVRQLLPTDAGHLDTFNKSALDYAREFNASPEIISLLEEYEE